MNDEDKARTFLDAKVYEKGYPVYQAHDGTGESLQGYYEVTGKALVDYSTIACKEKDVEIAILNKRLRRYIATLDAIEKYEKK